MFSMDTTEPTPEERTRARESATTWARRILDTPDVIIFDVETTGLDFPYIVEIAAINTAGETLLDTRLNPRKLIEPGATRVHGIRDEDVADRPTFADAFDEIANVFGGRTALSYNIGFDRGVMARELHRLYGRDEHGEPYPAGDAWMRRVTWDCIMRPYALHVGNWSPERGSYSWPRLPGGDHSALGDARSALAVLQTMATQVPATACTM